MRNIFQGQSNHGYYFYYSKSLTSYINIIKYRCEGFQFVYRDSLYILDYYSNVKADKLRIVYNNDKVIDSYCFRL